MHERDGIKVNFNWSRHRLFDRMAVVILYERCLAARLAKVTKVQEKPTKKWKPLPLTTVELQKMATRFLRITGQQAMTVAEKLYNRGFISYPRTETDRFDKGMDLRALVRKQTQDNRWGQFAQGLVDGGFQQPRQGRHDDKAHPPIHPITYAAPQVLDENERRVYELVTRRFLACCSEDAKGFATDIEILYGEETFNAHGVTVLERNYLEVYPYENWTGTAELPKFTVGERFEPTEATMTEGKTSPPGYLTEADLIALMDANGIGTDATMAEHIEKIQEREYARTVERGGGGANQVDDNDAEDPPARGGRGGRRGRGGRGGGRGGRGGGNSRGGRGVKEFIPTSLGVALIEGFDRMRFETSLGKPFLRKEMELKMKAICEGRTTKQVVLRESLTQYRQVYNQSREELNTLKAVRAPRRPTQLVCPMFFFNKMYRPAGNMSSRMEDSKHTPNRVSQCSLNVSLHRS
jgi:DNA topoisomerase-3